MTRPQTDFLRTMVVALTVAATLAVNVAPSSASEDEPTVIKFGDWMQFVLPAVALAPTLILKDREGTKQFALAGGTALVATHTIKYIVGETRPDRSDQYSWPSGHTSAAFFGPAFVHRRYGWKYSTPMYLCALITGYSRLLANKHWANDVFAGATVSLLSNWIFTTPYDGRVSVLPDVGDGRYGMVLSTRF